MNEWFEYRRNPEICYSFKQTSERRYRYCVWYVLTHVPKSLRLQYYAALPDWLSDKVRQRVEQLEKQSKKRRSIS